MVWMDEWDARAAAKREQLTQRLRVAEAAAARLPAMEDRLQQAGSALDEANRRHDTAVACLDQQMARLHRDVAEARSLLDAVYRSSSWRLSAPVRALSRSLRWLRRAPEPPPVQPEPQPVAAPVLPVAIPAPARVHLPSAAPRSWFYLGDTIDWLLTHGQLTGVGRVTTELFFAAAACGERPVIPCVLGPGTTLVPVAMADAAAFLTARGGAPTPGPGPGPTAGDHVLFTGVVWTPEYRVLFQRLASQRVHVGVLVYDIIPIERPEFVSPAHAAMFHDWLGAVLALATVVFVSSDAVGDQIRRWAALSCLPLAATIVPVRFGVRVPLAGDPMHLVRPGRYVLSVGTIDRRKNQAMLVRLWAALVAERGSGQAPQLVLVGRDDLGLASDGDAGLFARGDVVVLEGVDDADLAGLYRGCLLTIFPTLAEGYGLPVAESLAHGKLCLVSDLAPVREHAGDLVWYFAPGDEAAAGALLRQAIDDAPARGAAEARIAAGYRPPSWDQAWATVAQAAALLATGHPLPPPPPEDRPVIGGVPAAAVRAALATAADWCSGDDPVVSIVIVNWNASRLTRECLRQVWANTAGRRYEVIVVDNGSAAEDLVWLQALGGGVRLLPLGINRYFGEANNIAAELARGRYLCVLNNDAFVTPGWLPPLADALERDASVGAAGPLFLFPGGRIQEAGAAIGPGGIPIRFGRNEAEDAAGALAARDVDYISAAALLIRRDLFMAAGGFDLAYEPAYYEDVDLCFRLRATGHAVRFCPQSRVIHVEGAATDDAPAQARRNALGNLNRGKFMARWGAAVTGDQAALRAAAPRPPAAAAAPARAKTAALFTPYPLALGGGERYLLTLAAALAIDHAVTIVTPHPYSGLRLHSLGQEMGIDLSGCRLATGGEGSALPAADVGVVLGNHILPPVPAWSANTSYICQFPFPLPPGAARAGLPGIGAYRRVIVYSEYARAHVQAALSADQMPPWPVEVIHPAVPQHAGDPRRKARMILSVGRFFQGGHSKRHDLMLAAFRMLLQGQDGPLELHLAGASMPGAEHMDHLGALREMAAGLPVHFHVNAPPALIGRLYADAAVYWHAAGLGAALAQTPQDAEHFGISVVEAMSAGCAVAAFNAGGPREIVTNGVDGFLYDTDQALLEVTRRLLADAPLRERIGGAAVLRAGAFSPEAFGRRVRDVLCS